MASPWSSYAPQTVPARVAAGPPDLPKASSYILDISHFERQCFESYFELRQPQESLKTLLETAANIFYQALRPVAIACSDLNSLREIADCLQMDVLEPHQHSAKGDLVPVLATAGETP